MEEVVTQINGGIMINVDVSVKNVMYVKKIIFGILLPVIEKMENIQQVLWMIQQLCVMKLIESYTRLSPKDDNDETNFNEKKTICKT